MKHNKSLDSLLGLATLSVFFCYLYKDQFNYSNRLLFACRNEAVILFFVLIGFVLSIGFNKGETSYAEYVIRRVLRIYPVYWVALILAFIINSFTPDMNLSVLGIIKSIFLITQPSIHHNILYPSWSLAYELIIFVVIRHAK